ncbi:MAG TPA: 30S ribosomal protein S6 [Dehalococcoidia bacterium]|jgi:small subunit ribosomal protein S6|nr:30S ribosomal protein S6 [Dehalococcoidia bacterium]
MTVHQYELVTILSPQLGEEELPAAVERINAFIASRGGEVTNVDEWGRRRLAYPIERFNEGNYFVTELTLDSARAAELEANLKISEDVIRHLLVRKDEK